MLQLLLPPRKFATRLACIIFLLTTTSIFNSCKKDSQKSIEEEDSEIATKKPGTGKYPGPCPYPCGDPKCIAYQEPPPGCSGGGGGGGTISTPPIYLQNFFSTYDTNIIASTDSLQVAAYMSNKNQELINLLSANFPNTYTINELSSNDVMITWAGLIHMLAEGQGKFSSQSGPQAKIDLDWGCVKGVLFGFFDIASLVEDYVHLIQSGGSWSTVRGLLWRTLKRYGGWMAAAGVVYEIATECF